MRSCRQTGRLSTLAEASKRIPIYPRIERMSEHNASRANTAATKSSTSHHSLSARRDFTRSIGRKPTIESASILTAQVRSRTSSPRSPSVSAHPTKKGPYDELNSHQLRG